MVGLTWRLTVPVVVVRRFQVLKVFRRFGNVTKVEFLWHRDGPRRGQPRGYCFVEFEKHEVRGEGVAAASWCTRERCCRCCRISSIAQALCCRHAHAGWRHRVDVSAYYWRRTRMLMLTMWDVAVCGLPNQEAAAAKAGIHSKPMLGRPVVVRFVNERVVTNPGVAEGAAAAPVFDRDAPRSESAPEVSKDKLEAVYDSKRAELERHLESLVRQRAAARVSSRSPRAVVVNVGRMGKRVASRVLPVVWAVRVCLQKRPKT